MSISQIRTQKYESGHFDPFLITRKIRTIGGRIRNHSHLRARPENFEIIFLLISKE